MKKTLKLIGLILVATTAAFAQGPATGRPPFGSFQGGAFDSVNLENLNVNFQVPILSLPGRGIDFNYSLAYDSSIYKKVDLGSSSFAWRPVVDQDDVATWGWSRLGKNLPRVTYSTSQILICDWDSGLTDPEGQPIIIPQYNTWYHSYKILRGDGTVHPFDLSFYGIASNPLCPGPTYNTGPRTGHATDNSGFHIDATTATDPIPTGPNGGEITSIEFKDRNGNYMGRTATAPEEWTDTLGRVVLSIAEVTESGVDKRKYTYKDAAGTSHVIIEVLQDISVTTSFSCSGVAEYFGTATVIDKIRIPIDSVPNYIEYDFDYDTATGQLLSVTLPTGGKYTYSYDAIDCVTGSVTDMTRTIDPDPSVSADESVWDYLRTTVVGGWETKITAPTYLAETDETVVTFGGDKEKKREIYEGTVSGGTKLRTIDTVWAPNGTPANRIVTLEDGTTKSMVVTTYDDNGNLELAKAYDWGASSPTRTAELIYETGSNYTSRNLNGLVKEIKFREGDATGTIKAHATITYDSTTTLGGTSGVAQHDYTGYPNTMIYRGNRTKVEVWRDSDGDGGGAIWLSTLLTYNDLGNLTKATDPGSHDTDLDYTDSWSVSACTVTNSQAHVTKVTNPLSHEVKTKYFPCTSAPQESLDINSQATTFDYDLAGRLAEAIRPDTGVTTLSYDYANRKVTSVTDIDSTLDLTVEQYTDKLGRALWSKLPGDPDGATYGRTGYDSLGRANRSWNPTRCNLGVSTPPTSCSGEETFGKSESRFDALGRVVLIIPPDGTASTNNITVTYDLNCTTVSDQAGKKRKSCTDGLGRLAEVWEPNSSGSFVHQTVYTYDVLDNLTKVEQKASGSSSSQWRTRTMTYNSLSQMLSIDNPETGELSYGYNSEGNLDKLTDGRLIITTYAYDSLDRLTQKSYSDGVTPTVKYFYDGEIPNGTNCPTWMILTPTYPEGRMTGMCDGPGGEAWGYDKMGRVVDHKRNTSGVPAKDLQYGYNLGGGLTTITSVWGGWTQIYGYNAVGRVTSLTDGTGNNYASGITYHPHGAMRSRSLDGGSMFQQHLFNKRLQPCRLFVRASGTTPVPADCADASPATGRLMDFKLEYDEGAADNGSLTKLTDHAQGITYDYTYDEMNRIKTAAATGSSPWSQDMDYDAWGNMNIPTASNAPMLNLTKTVKNRIDTAAHTGYDYDLSGNQTEDPGVPGTLVYDAEGRVLSIGTAIEYQYNGLGQRVLKKTATEERMYIFNAVTGAVYQERVFDGTNWVHDRYRFHLNGVQLASQKSGEWWKYTFQDNLGTTRVRTNRFGTTVFSRHDFYPFGGEHTTVSSDESRMFTGQERDGESGLDHFWFRKYQSISGRWTSPDPLGMHSTSTCTNPRHSHRPWVPAIGRPQEANLYAYVANNPTNSTDPLGLDMGVDWLPGFGPGEPGYTGHGWNGSEPDIYTLESLLSGGASFGIGSESIFNQGDGPFDPCNACKRDCERFALSGFGRCSDRVARRSWYRTIIDLLLQIGVHIQPESDPEEEIKTCAINAAYSMRTCKWHCTQNIPNCGDEPPPF